MSAKARVVVPFHAAKKNPAMDGGIEPWFYQVNDPPFGDGDPDLAFQAVEEAGVAEWVTMPTPEERAAWNAGGKRQRIQPYVNAPR